MVNYNLIFARAYEKEEAKSQTDALEAMVMGYVEKVQHLVTDGWRPRHHDLWRKIYKTFKKEISKAGPHEKFKEYSKKTLYCIIGHLKQKGAYKQISNLELTVTLEGMNNGMRKYLNSGLVELEQSLRERIESFVDLEMQRLVAVE